MKTCLCLIAVLAAALSACGTDSTNESSLSAAEEVGTLQLALRGADPSLQTYRLRNANFAVQGVRYTDYQSVMTTLSSETSPDSDTLDAKLLYGSYVVSLQNADWYLERITPNGAERVAQAVLLSPAQQSVFLDQGQLARVAFQFGVDGDLVDFFGGQLEIGITVRQAPAADAGVLSLP